MNVALNNPRAIAEAGERLYAERFKEDYEAQHHGMYAVINVIKENAFVGKTPEEAFLIARKNDPTGVFHLVRIGYTGAFQMSYNYRHAGQDWLFR